MISVQYYECYCTLLRGQGQGQGFNPQGQGQGLNHQGQDQGLKPQGLNTQDQGLYPQGQSLSPQGQGQGVDRQSKEKVHLYSASSRHASDVLPLPVSRR